MELQELEKVIRLFEKANITSLDIEMDGAKIKLTKSENQVCLSQANVPASEEKKEEKTPEADGKVVHSPLVGAFHLVPYQDAAPFVSVGSKVKKGDLICIIEAMKVMNEIHAPQDGVIKEIYLKEGDIAEFDAPLFLMGE